MLAHPRACHPCVLALALCGCNFMINPERVDGLVRCETDDDCPETDDTRYAQKCMLSDDVELDNRFLEVEKVCIAVFEPLSCKAGTHPNTRFERLYNASRASDGALYKSSCGGHEGKQGCWARGDGTCEGDLEVNSKTGLCDDDDPLTPPALQPVEHIAGQDVADQFCRSYFCDIEFTCATFGKAKTCVPCTLGQSLGGGGCGDLYFDGEPSPVYQTHEELQDTCMAPDSDPEEVVIGPLYEPPPDMPGD